jgi:hypothetical protein
VWTYRSARKRESWKEFGWSIWTSWKHFSELDIIMLFKWITWFCDIVHRTLYIYDCSNNFKHRDSFVDLSVSCKSYGICTIIRLHKIVFVIQQTVESRAQTATSAQPSKKAASASQLASASKVCALTMILQLYYLLLILWWRLLPLPSLRICYVSGKNNSLICCELSFCVFFPVVDSPNPVTLHLVLASFSNWREGQRNTHTTTAQRRSPKPVSAQPQPPSSRPNSSGEPPQNGSDSGEQASAEPEYVIAGSLIVEEYSWKSIQSGKYVLRLTTTGTKGTSVTLPPGLANIGLCPILITTLPCIMWLSLVVMCSSCTWELPLATI